MSLDLFASNIDDAVNYAARTSGAELPSTFSDSFNDAWNKGYLVNQSISGEIRKTTARSQMVDDAIAKTGDQSFGQSGEGGGFDTAAFNAKVAQHKALKPDLELNPISDEAVQARADEIGVRQLADSAHMAGRERTTGGAIGSFLGTAAGALSDPVNLIAFPLAAPESLGVLGTALAWGAIGGGSQVAIEALNAPAMERIQPGYSTSGQPVTNVLESALGGAVLGGGLKGLSSAWQRVKTGEWPRTVRDAGNVVESEAQIAATNPLPGIDGEAAHRTALNKAIDDIANNRPVDVEGIVTPEQAAHIDAWHGSPHDFEAFDVSRIGTGEGAQAYGHGLYFAENEGTALSYKDTYVPYRTPVDAQKYGLAEADAARISSDFTHFRMNKSVEAIDDEIASRLQYPRTGANALALDILQGPKPEGNIYKVKITANKDHMLDWDKPLNEQSPDVQAALNRLADKHGISTAFDGASFYDDLKDALKDPSRKLPPDENGLYRFDDGREAASRALAEAGIPGIKYLDQGSRVYADALENHARGLKSLQDIRERAVQNATLTAEEKARSLVDTDAMIADHVATPPAPPSRNIVVFDDKHVQITHKNGKPVNAEIRQSIVDQAAGLPPKQPELPLAQSEPPTPLQAPKHQASQPALDDQLTPENIEKMRVDPDLGDTVSRDLDKLMLEKPDLEVPTGVTVDAEGRTIPTTRKVESVIAEADARSAAAKEIEACVGPYPTEAAA